MDQNTSRHEHGQNLVIFAVLLVVFIALAGLVIDGGFSLVVRREAQNAADAGALAGANMLCSTDPIQTPYDAAWDYAVNRNGASDAEIVIDDEAKTVSVTTLIPHHTFLMRAFGSDVVDVTAIASAGCSPACEGTGIFPVAWACKAPIGEEADPNCEIEYGTLDEAGPTYVIMDSNKADEDYQCQSAGGSLNCDIDGDGEDEYMVGGGRSWLDLDAAGHGSIDLVDWILQREKVTIKDHMWLPGTDGTATDIFRAAETRMNTNPLVVLPVFNDYTVACVPSDPYGGCNAKWHEGLDQIRTYSAGSADYYHIISFSIFKLTCVSRNQGQECPGKQFLLDNGYPDMDNNTKTVEGYFVEGSASDLIGRCDYDAGAYTIYLNK